MGEDIEGQEIEEGRITVDARFSIHWRKHRARFRQHDGEQAEREERLFSEYWGCKSLGQTGRVDIGERVASVKCGTDAKSPHSARGTVRNF